MPSRTRPSRRRLVAGATVAIAAVTAGTALHAGAGRHDGTRLIDTKSLVGVQAPYLGATNPIRGVNGGGLPWVVGHGELQVRNNGRVELEVEGLVIDPTNPVAIARGIAGTNPSPTFKVIVSCQTLGGTAPVNVSTETTPASADGNAELDTMVSLPSPCLAPVAFVASGTGAWFAVNGG
jgi:hypothetical protein